MDLNHYVRVLRRHLAVFLALVAVAILGAAVAAWTRPSLYQTSTTLVATVGGSALPADEATLRQAAAGRASTVSQFVTTTPVLQAVIAAAAQASGIAPHAPEAVTVAADGVSPFLTIAVTDSDPRWAQAVANAYQGTLPRALSSIDPNVAEAAGGLNTLTAAPLPGQPVSPNRKLYLVYGLFFGVVLGLGVVVLREALTRRVADPEDVGRALAIPVLGAIPLEDPKRALPMRSAPHSSRAEAYRAVLANLPFLTVPGEGTQSLLVTSTTRGEGVSSLAGNLAVALARSGRRVLLVDANLRAPHLHELFDLPASPGLSEVLSGEASLQDTVHQLEGGLRVLTAGEPPEDPVERLTSGRAANLIDSLGAGSDVVILDSPPVVPVADALFLARQVGSVILATRLRTTRKDQLLRAGDALFQIRAPLAGVVVNGVGGRNDRLRPTRRHGRAANGTPLTAGVRPGAVATVRAQPPHGGVGLPEAG